jgi:hypothetical protein
MGETLRVSSADRLTVNDSQFQWKRQTYAAQETAAWLAAVAAYSAEVVVKAGSAKARQPPKFKINGWEAAVP